MIGVCVDQARNNGRLVNENAPTLRSTCRRRSSTPPLILHTRAGDRYRTKQPNTHPINSSTSPAIRASAARGRKKDTRATTPKDTMMRQTKGRVAALIVAVFCVLGLIWIPHQASAQTWVGNPPNGGGKALSTRVRNPGNGGGKKVGTAGSGSYLLNLLPPTSGATDTFTDITNADAFVSSFRPFYGGYGGYSARCTAIGC